MKPPITTKTAMYRLLVAGQLGNTIPQFFDRAVWSRFVGEQVDRFPLWGVRHASVAGHPHSRLNVPTAEVYKLLDSWYPSGTGFNLSPMIQRYALLNAQTDGTTLEWIEPTAEWAWGKAAHPWRYGFLHYRRETYSPAAIRSILRAYLSPAALEQFDGLMDDYPGHVVEFTATDRDCGPEPFNNMTVWEVRLY